jgi:hypothetical protein
MFDGTSTPWNIMFVTHRRWGSGFFSTPEMLANEATLRSFYARIFGWANDRAVDHAIRSREIAGHRTDVKPMLNQQLRAQASRCDSQPSAHPTIKARTTRSHSA